MQPIDKLRIKLLNLILNYVGSHYWKNYDNFTEDFVERIISSFQRGNFDLLKIISKAPTTFFRLNSITKESFLTAGLAQKIKELWEREIPIIVDFVSIFPEIKMISDEEATSLIAKIGIPEEDIQNALRAALRSKGATSIPRRGKDSPLEIADIEHFRLTISGKTFTFVVVVKGYDSIKSVRLSWKDIAHQVTRAYSATHPDYLLILTAKEPKDGVITHLTKFAQDVDNPNLVIFVTPLELVKFLRAFGAI